MDPAKQTPPPHTNLYFTNFSSYRTSNLMRRAK